MLLKLALLLNDESTSALVFRGITGHFGGSLFGTGLLARGGTWVTAPT